MSKKIASAALLVSAGAMGCRGGDAVGARAPETRTAAAEACDAASARMIRGLGSPVRVTAYLTRGLPKLDAAARQVDDFFARLQRAAPGKLTYRAIDPRSDALRDEAKEAGLQQTVFAQEVEAQKDAAQVVRGYFGIAFQMAGEKEMVPVMDPGAMAGLEYWMIGKLRELRARVERRHLSFGVVGGKDEVGLGEADLIATPVDKPGPTLIGIMHEALPYYDIHPVDLGGGARELDPSLRGVIVTQPGRDYTDAELRVLDRFLMRGDKAVLIAASAFGVPGHAPYSHADLTSHGLEKLLAGYGIELKREAIFDWAGAASLRVTSEGKDVVLRLPMIVDIEADADRPLAERHLDPDFAAFFRIDELTFPFASPLAVHPEKQPGVSLRVVARTSAKAVTVATSPVDISFGASPPPEHGGAAHPVAVAVEGPLRSAFGAGVAPAPDRVLVVSSAQFFTNPLAHAGNRAADGTGGDGTLQILAQPYAQKYLVGTILAFKNTLDWMANEDGLGACAAAIPTSPRGHPAGTP